MQKKPGKALLPIRMIPYDAPYDHVAARVMTSNAGCLVWLQGEPMPEGLMDELVGAIRFHHTLQKPAGEPRGTTIRADHMTYVSEERGLELGRLPEEPDILAPVLVIRRDVTVNGVHVGESARAVPLRWVVRRERLDG